jgi:CheY-like chemotaxis protein
MRATLMHNPQSGDRTPSAKKLARWIEKLGYRVRYQSTKEKNWAKAPPAVPEALRATSYGRGRVMPVTPKADRCANVCLMVSPEGTAPTGIPLRILVVDDIDLVLDLTVRTLHEAGIEAIAAIDGPAALALLEATPLGWFALILTNTVMPSMTGAELIQRALERDPNQRALHMTGHPDRHFDAEAGVAGHVPRAPEAVLTGTAGRGRQ